MHKMELCSPLVDIRTQQKAYRIRLKEWRPMLNKEVLISTQPKPNAPTPIAVNANPLKFVDYRPVIYVDHWTDRPYVYYYYYYC